MNKIIGIAPKNKHENTEGLKTFKLKKITNQIIALRKFSHKIDFIFSFIRTIFLFSSPKFKNEKNIIVNIEV